MCVVFLLFYFFYLLLLFFFQLLILLFSVPHFLVFLTVSFFLFLAFFFLLSSLIIYIDYVLCICTVMFLSSIFSLNYSFFPLHFSLESISWLIKIHNFFSIYSCPICVCMCLSKCYLKSMSEFRDTFCF